MMYHPIKFGRKKISSSADMVETVIFGQMRHHCDPEFEDRKSIFLHDTLAHGVEETSSRWTFTGILNLFCDLDLDPNKAIQSFHQTIQSDFAWHSNS